MLDDIGSVGNDVTVTDGRDGSGADGKAAQPPAGAGDPLQRERRLAALIAFAPALPAVVLLGGLDLHPVSLAFKLAGLALLYAPAFIGLWKLETRGRINTAGLSAAIATGAIYIAVGLGADGGLVLATPLVAGAPVGCVWLAEQLQAGRIDRTTIIVYGTVHAIAFAVSFWLWLWLRGSLTHSFPRSLLAWSPGILAPDVARRVLRSVRRRGRTTTEQTA